MILDSRDNTMNIPKNATKFPHTVIVDKYCPFIFKFFDLNNSLRVDLLN